MFVLRGLSSAGARAALSAVRSTLITGHESYIRSVCQPEGLGTGDNVDAVAAVAAAAAEQLGGAASSSNRATGRGRGRGKGKGGRGADNIFDEQYLSRYPLNCVVDGDTGALLFLS